MKKIKTKRELIAAYVPGARLRNDGYYVDYRPVNVINMLLPDGTTRQIDTSFAKKCWKDGTFSGTAINILTHK